MEMIKWTELKIMTETITALSDTDRNYQMKLEKDQKGKWFLTIGTILNGQVIDEKVVTQSRSDNPKTFRLLEDALQCALEQCVGLGDKAGFKIMINGEEWGLSK